MLLLVQRVVVVDEHDRVDVEASGGLELGEVVVEATITGLVPAAGRRDSPSCEPKGGRCARFGRALESPLPRWRATRC